MYTKVSVTLHNNVFSKNIDFTTVDGW